MLRAQMGLGLRFSLIMALLLLAIGRPAHAATITVVNTNDSGPGSLRQAIADAVSSDTIDFALGGCPCTITLTSGELVIDKNLTISGPGAQALTISGNSTTRVFRFAPSVIAEMSGLRVSDGRAVHGGGIWVERGVALTLREAIISGNTAEQRGGGIWAGDGNLPDPTLTVIDSLFSNNQAFQGGAIYNSQATLTVRDTDFLTNTTTGGGGGAIFNQALARIIGGTFSGNSSSDFGGAVLAAGFSTLVGSTITDNHVLDGFGGGIAAFGNLAVINCTITGNSAEFGAAGVYAESLLTPSPSINVMVVNSTIVLNQGEGVDATKVVSAVLYNTIVAGNTDFDVSGAFEADSSNLIGGDVASIIDTTLANNGGPTRTFALVPNSPAIGAGNNTWLPADELDLDGDGNTSELIPFDQRGVGFPRVQGTVDIGAVEAACPAITIGPLPSATVGGIYSQILSAIGGQSPHTFSAATLPPGLTLTPQGVLSGTPTAVGTFTFTVTVVEDGGCASTVELTLTVGFPFSGFFAPVDNLPTVNTVNAGRAIPIKFSLGGNRGLNIFAAGYPQVQQMACDSGALQDAIEETVTAGNSSLSYHAGSDTYSYVWKTNKAWAGTCWQLTLRLIDGTDHSANFAFK